MTRPLAGIRILDLTLIFASPFATMVLADLAKQSGSSPIDSFSTTMYVTICALGVFVLVVGYLGNRSKGLPLGLVFAETPRSNWR